MREFDLKTLNVTTLDDSELIELQKYLKRCHYRDVVVFLMVGIMDNVVENNYDKAVNFLKVSGYFKLLKEIQIAVNDTKNILVEKYTEDDWINLEKKCYSIKVMMRKDKIKKINESFSN